MDSAREARRPNELRSGEGTSIAAGKGQRRSRARGAIRAKSMEPNRTGGHRAGRPAGVFRVSSADFIGGLGVRSVGLHWRLQGMGRCAGGWPDPGTAGPVSARPRPPPPGRAALFEPEASPSRSRILVARGVLPGLAHWQWARPPGSPSVSLTEWLSFPGSLLDVARVRVISLDERARQC